MTQGIKFPLKINDSGRFATSSGDDKIKQNLRHIVLTFVAERPYEPAMGSPNYLGLLRAFDTGTGLQLSELLQQTIHEQEPRVQCKVIFRSNTEGRVVFDIVYAIKETGLTGSTRIEVT